MHDEYSNTTTLNTQNAYPSDALLRSDSGGLSSPTASRLRPNGERLRPEDSRLTMVNPTVVVGVRCAPRRRTGRDVDEGGLDLMRIARSRAMSVLFDPSLRGTARGEYEHGEKGPKKGLLGDWDPSDESTVVEVSQSGEAERDPGEWRYIRDTSWNIARECSVGPFMASGNLPNSRVSSVLSLRSPPSVSHQPPEGSSQLSSASGSMGNRSAARSSSSFQSE